MQKIRDIRTISHQLDTLNFNTPKDIVKWMGAIQAQDYNMSKWAMGIRLKNTTLNSIENALSNGEILRTHVMRPTWHLVPAEDILWMLKLTAHRINFASGDRALGVTEELYTKTNNILEKILVGNNHLTRQEVAQEFINAGIEVNNSRMMHFMIRAEFEGIVCSGIDKGNKPTYALIGERVPNAKHLPKDEALIILATRYFQSHSPASLPDFVWWSGLTKTEAKQAINLIKQDLFEDKLEENILYIHKTYNTKIKSKNNVYLLPSYDEYLISYKDRTSVLEREHYSNAFNNFGIFYPVIVYNGKVIGNWKKGSSKKPKIETSFFDKNIIPDNNKLENAIAKYADFITKT